MLNSPDILGIVVNNTTQPTSGDGFVITALSGTANPITPQVTILSSGFVTYNKESINVSANSRVTTQQVKFHNESNEYWGRFSGVFSGIVSGFTDIKIEWGNISGDIDAQHDLINRINESVSGLSAAIPVPSSETLSTYTTSGGITYFDVIGMKSISGDVFYVETFYNDLLQAIETANSYARSISGDIVSKAAGDAGSLISSHNIDLTSHNDIRLSEFAHTSSTDNPHQVTKEQLGLDTVENLSISGSIDSHNTNLSSHSDIREYITTHIYDTTNPHLVSKDQVGLGSVENLSISGTVSSHNISPSAHSDQFSPLTSHLTNYSNPHQVTKSQVGLGNVENLSISGSISTHNSSTSAHQDIRNMISQYEWYVDETVTPLRLKRIDSDDFYFCVEIISSIDKTLKIINSDVINNPAIIFPSIISISTGSIRDNWKVIRIQSMNNYYSLADIKTFIIEDILTVDDWGCTNLYGCEYISLPNATVIGTGCFYEIPLLNRVNIPNVTAIPDNCFTRCISLSHVILDKVTTIGDNAFGEIEIPNTTLIRVYAPHVVSVGTACFVACSNLSYVYMPLVETIGLQAFALCTSLTTLDFPVCTSLGQYSMYDVPLSNLYIPNITTIGDEAFGQNTPKSINITVTNKSVLSNISLWDSNNSLSASKIKVPYEYLSQWQAVYPTLVIDGTWTIEAYSDNDTSTRIQAHNTATDSHQSIRTELAKCPTTQYTTGYDNSKQYAFIPNANGTIKLGDFQEIVIPPGVTIDSSSITENLSGNIQAVGVIDGSGVLISGSTIRSAISITWDI